MSDTIFTGFGGVRLAAHVHGEEDAPAVLLLHAPGQSRAMWGGMPAELAQAGRRVINLDLRGSGASDAPRDGRYDLDAQAMDVRMVLGALASRPVIIAASQSGWTALAALEHDGANLAAGLIIVDSMAEAGETGFDLASASERVQRAAPTFTLPLLFIAGHDGADSDQPSTPAAHFPDSETMIIEDAANVINDTPDELNGALIDFLERRVPRTFPEYRAGSDARTLRDAMGLFATGVTIVTTYDADGKPIGLTANSFTSVSLNPPLLLVCIAKTAGSLRCFEANERFAINVLQIGQQPASDRFARRGEDRFADTQWEPGEFGSPVLHNSLTNFECKRYDIYEGGDHIILVGEVLKAQFEPRRDPLLYFRGKYRRLHFT